jgi:hypothetical protein
VIISSIISCAQNQNFCHCGKLVRMNSFHFNFVVYCLENSRGELLILTGGQLAVEDKDLFNDCQCK